MSACVACGGDGFFEVDEYDRRGEHYTKRVPCLACVEDDEEEEFDNVLDGLLYGGRDHEVYDQVVLEELGGEG